MQIKALAVFLVSITLWIGSWCFAPSALAVTQIKLYNLNYHECPQELAQGAVTSGGTTRPANCFIIDGQAQNPSPKTVYDADVYGRIYDADNNPILENRTRIGSIEELPPGTSDFQLRISVPSNMPTPLQLKQFKASAFSSSVKAKVNR
ncbi:hypothetical protein [Merismopedia glauca]|uniref:Biotin carboxylase n=1 Tax=Merismopedia glauca CCAP 1448/3 TaxID=1296344 RepID=A0A2T1C1L3_9CYAN|nr:hypothetical protein [Merismopedia glauca]PSB02166.1 hypothetical protein C7B64_14585 [Merismopedia glauca CCAP 1448/3]